MNASKADPVGIVEIAERLSVAHNTVSVWRTRPATGFPEPRWTVSGNPAWNWADIERWARKSGRLESAPA